MEAMEDAATPCVDVDAAKDTINLTKTAHPKKVFVQTQETTDLIMDTRNQSIRCKHPG